MITALAIIVTACLVITVVVTIATIGIVMIAKAIWQNKGLEEHGK